MRAFTVRVNDVSGVGGFLLPDNHVDVLASRKLSGMNEEERTETIIQDIKDDAATGGSGVQGAGARFDSTRSTQSD